jgi:hypothetical protein
VPIGAQTSALDEGFEALALALVLTGGPRPDARRDACAGVPEPSLGLGPAVSGPLDLTSSMGNDVDVPAEEALRRAPTELLG